MEIPVNKRIEQLLDHFKITQKQLSELAGISENTISNAKKGKNIPGVDFFNAIYKSFPNLNPQWLYIGQGAMFTDGTNPNINSENNGKASKEDYIKKVKLLQKEIQYLQVQIKDKEEIIELLKSKLQNTGGQ